MFLVETGSSGELHLKQGLAVLVAIGTARFVSNTYAEQRA